MAVVNIIPVLYVADNTYEFQVGVDAAVYNQEADDDVSKLGGPIPAVSVAGLPALPSSVKPRRQYVKNPAGKGRYVICLTPDAYIGNQALGTISLEDSNNVPTTFTREKGMLGEDFGKTFHNG